MKKKKEAKLIMEVTPENIANMTKQAYYTYINFHGDKRDKDYTINNNDNKNNLVVTK